MDNSLNTLRQTIEQAQHIVVVSHARPDGDALGSAGGWWAHLRSLGKDAVVLLEDKIPGTLHFMFKDVDYVYGEQQAGSVLENCDLLICTDFNVMSRTGILEKTLLEAGCTKFLFDHHQNPQLDQFDAVWSNPGASSACELVYFILKEAYGSMNLATGTLLMTGMTTDTNNFANSVTPGTLTMAGELMALGVDRDDILDKLYHSYRENRLRAMSYFVSQMHIMENGVAYIIVRQKDWEEFGLLEGELEGLVNQPLSIEKVKVSIYLREDADQFRVSVRAKRGYSALEIASSLFHGGGHILASGGKLLIGEDVPTPDHAASFIEKNVKI